MSIAIVAEFKIQSGRGDDFADYISWHQSESRKEPGCQLFSANRDPEAPLCFVMYEIYDDDAAISAHRQTAHYQKFASEIVPDMVEMQGDDPFVSRRFLSVLD